MQEEVTEQRVPEGKGVPEVPKLALQLDLDANANKEKNEEE